LDARSERPPGAINITHHHSDYLARDPVAQQNVAVKLLRDGSPRVRGDVSATEE
jgi:L-ascorbate metabolism protein UlaG (beta-lactamase superfamily)